MKTDTKTKASYTPGPWRTVRRSNQCGIRSLIIDTGHLTGGTYCKQGSSELQEEDEANARLIAAAPDLLSAVYDLLDIVQTEYANDPEPEDLPSWKRAIEQAEAAIAKAEGEK